MQLTRDIAFYGIQGSGKTTQAKILCEKTQAILFSFGNEIRRRIAVGDEIGRAIGERNQRGELATREIIEMITADFFTNNAQHRIAFDSPVRTLSARDIFDTWLQKQDRNWAIIHLTLDEATTRARIAQQPKRDDASAEAINRRLELFYKETVPVIETYRQEGVPVFEIDASRDIDTIAAEIEQVLTPYLQK